MAEHMEDLKTTLESIDDSNKEDNQQPQMYAKDSMDRFDNDLCALVLSYLTFEDRFRCECVSKQFQRTVFKSVVDINIDNKLTIKIWPKRAIISTLLATIITKCPNIQTIDCTKYIFQYGSLIPEVLTIFRDTCLQLREIYYNLHLNTDVLLPSLAPLITRIHEVCDSKKRILTYCHRLSYLHIGHLSTIYGKFSRKILVNNLHKFEFNYKSYEDKELLSALVAQKQSLKSVWVNNLSYNINESLIELSTQLSRLPQLRELTLDLRVNSGDNSLSESLRTIGVNCKQLKCLDVFVRFDNFRLNGQLFDSLRCYRRLKRLHLYLSDCYNAQVLVPLKHCHQLTHLTIDTEKMSDKWLDNCDRYWPRVKYLSLRVYSITRKRLDYISRLPALQTLDIICHHCNGICDNDFNHMLSKSPKLKTIEFWVKLYEIEKFYCRKHF